MGCTRHRGIGSLGRPGFWQYCLARYRSSYCLNGDSAHRAAAGAWISSAPRIDVVATSQRGAGQLVPAAGTMASRRRPACGAGGLVGGLRYSTTWTASTPFFVHVVLNRAFDALGEWYHWISWAPRSVEPPEMFRSSSLQVFVIVA